MAHSSQKVSLEALAENEILEIAYDGREETVIPMHLSDNLAKLAQLIDFGKEDDERLKQVQETTPQPTVKDKGTENKQSKAWPWEFLRTSLISSLTEMNVLSDCLAIAKEKRLMLLDKVENDFSESKSAYQLVTRKQALQNAATIFNRGAEKLKDIQAEAVSKSQQSSEFYSELWNLRQHWRIKRVGQHILGDLSYKSAGSSFWQSGTFEVFKRTSEKPGVSAIDVRIPPELEGTAYIQVSIHMTTPEDHVSKLNAMLTIPQKLPISQSQATRWDTKLEAAQNIIYCKELFSQLSREAFKLNSTVSHMVANNQVIVHLFPGFKMHLMFVHSDTEDKAADSVPPISDPTLQLALHQLLRIQQYHNLHKDPPHPVTGSIGPTKRRRLAGPFAAPRDELLTMDRPDQESILEKILDMGRHVVLRLRIVETIEHLALTISDPLIHVHTDGLSDSLHSSLRVTITSPNYDLIKSWFILKICGGKVTAIGKSGIEINLSHETQRLEDYIMWQICQYQIQVVCKLANMMGYNVLSYSFSSASYHTEVFGTSPSILVSSDDGCRALAVRANTVSGLEVLVSESGKTEDVCKDLITDKRWALIRQSFKQVDLTRMAEDKDNSERENRCVIPFLVPGGEKKETAPHLKKKLTKSTAKRQNSALSNMLPTSGRLHSLSVPRNEADLRMIGAAMKASQKQPSLAFTDTFITQPPEFTKSSKRSPNFIKRIFKRRHTLPNNIFKQFLTNEHS